MKRYIGLAIATFIAVTASAQMQQKGYVKTTGRMVNIARMTLIESRRC